jgi:mRNA interferase MazF
VKRGELWTIAGGPGFAGKPRPALIVQDDAYPHTSSVTVCPITSGETEAQGLREPIPPDSENGLLRFSLVMIDKISTLPRGRLGRQVGRLSSDDLARVDRALLVFLGLAG